MRELLALRVSPKTSSAEIRKRAEAKITDIEGKIKSLESMRKSLRKLTNACVGCGPISECPIIESLDRESLVEAEFGCHCGRRRVVTAQVGLPTLLASLCRFAQFDWPWLPHLDQILTAANGCVLDPCHGISGIQSEGTTGIRPVRVGLVCCGRRVGWQV
ncbi:MAG TPA: MerR family DNA-binding protein [Candidatus Angelobacter sp.]